MAEIPSDIVPQIYTGPPTVGAVILFIKKEMPFTMHLEELAYAEQFAQTYLYLCDLPTAVHHKMALVLMSALPDDIEGYKAFIVMVLVWF